MDHTTQDIPYGYCHCGCGQKTTISIATHRKQRRVKGEPMRFVHGHNAQKDAVLRFWEKVDKRAPDDCWEWTGRTSRGRGMIGVGHKTYVASRFSWELHFGPIPDGMSVLHKCDNPLCCNPHHLFLGTQADNMKDMAAKQRNRRGESHYWAKLTEDEVIAIRARYATGNISQSKLAAEYNISQGGVADIVRRRIWRHVP